MILPATDPRHDLTINVLGGRVEIWPMHRSCHRGVLSKAGVHSGVTVRRGRVVRAVVDVHRCLSLMGQSIRLEWPARAAIMRRRLRMKQSNG